MAQNITSGTTTANTVATVTFSKWFSGIEIVNSGAADLWVRSDGIDPAIGADECQFVPARSWVVIRNLTPVPEVGGGITGSTTVKLISSTSTSYVISGGV